MSDATNAGLGRRCRQPEIMDQPDLDEPHHVGALRGLARINRWSGSARILWAPILRLAREGGAAPLRVLDIATGGGDIPIALWHKARRAGVALCLEGCDRSQRAVTFAGQRAREQGTDVRFFQFDVLSDPLPAGYDVLMHSLFLHHLDDEQAVDVLGRMAQAAGRLVLVNDLRRSRAGLALAYLGTRLLSSSEVVHADGPMSVRAAFTLDEAHALVRKAGLKGAVIEKRWPWRFLLAWCRPFP
jgi:SAM-dependent methyltransferase